MHLSGRRTTDHRSLGNPAKPIRTHMLDGDHRASTTLISRALRGLKASVSLAIVLAAAAALLPALAAASLPDNRIYEQVSPANKDGNLILPSKPFGEEYKAMLASPTGEAVMFESTGAVGKETNQGSLQEDIARRAPGVGWTTTPADSRPLGTELGIGKAPEFTGFFPSRDFSKVFFSPEGYATRYSTEEPVNGQDVKLYLSENPFEPPVWIGRPTAAHPVVEFQLFREPFYVVGVNPEGSTVDFNYSGTLLKEDEEPLAENAKKELVPGGRTPRVVNGASGFYEWHDGTLGEGGQLPDGKLSPYGASSIQMSEDGSRMIFVSPDPGVEQLEGIEPNTKPVAHPETPELYTRETLPDGEHKSLLLSRSEIATEEKHANANAAEEGAPEGAEVSFDTASSDGSHVFFSSNDALTTAAAVPHAEWQLYLEGSTGGGTSGYTGGTYELSVTAGAGKQTTAPIPWQATTAQVQSAVEALSNVGGGKVKVESGRYPGAPTSYLMRFTGLAPTTMEDELASLTGSGGNELSNVSPSSTMYDFNVETGQLNYLPELSGDSILIAAHNGSRVLFVNNQTGSTDLWNEGGSVEMISDQGSGGPARVSTDGNVFLYSANSELYRYEVSTKELICVSCSPRGIPNAPVETNTNPAERTTHEVALMSADGSRVFFQTTAPLVSADVNGMADVYEWENGRVYLISGGTALTPSFYIDNSETGGDVFFGTAQGLVPSDEDEQLDVYDARIPRPGDNPPPNQTPCSGDVCQGPPSVPELLTPGASATFKGLGNIPPEAEQTTTVKVTKPAAVKCKKGYVKKNGKCVKQKKKKKKKVKKSNRRGK